MFEKVGKSEYLLKNEKTGNYKIKLDYHYDEEVSNYYFLVIDQEYLDEIINGAIEKSLSEKKAKYDINTIKWFRQFFMDEELIEDLNEDICYWLSEYDEDYMEKQQKYFDEQEKEYERVKQGDYDASVQYFGY